MKNLLFKGVRAAALVAGLTAANTAFAAGAVPHIDKQHWTFSGPFGQFDKAQLQRGFQVYKEVCASCHSLNYVAFRNLAEEGGPGFSVEEVKALASEYSVMDGPDDEGEMFERAAVPADKIPAPFANKEAAAASNGGAYPPDLSLIAKARAATRGFPWFVLDIATQYQENGPDYIYNLLTGYEEEFPACAGEQGGYFNPVFLGGSMPASCEGHYTGGAIQMAPPLSDELVEYTDGSPMTTEQYAADVSAFLMWTAEPHLESRKRMGFGVMAFLILFASLLYFTKRKVWRDVEH